MAKRQRGALNPDDEDRLRLNWGLLNSELDGEDLVDTMFERGIFSMDDVTEVRDAVPRNRKTRTIVFLQKLCHTGVNGYGVFLEALRKACYQHVAEKLEKTVVPSHVERGPDLCSVCKEDGKPTPSAHWCYACQASFCEGCLRLHSKMPNSKYHEAVPTSEKGKHIDKDHMSLRHDRDSKKKDIEVMEMKINKLSMKSQQIDNIDLTASPVLDEVIEAKLNVGDSCRVTDGLIMNSAGTKVTVFTENITQCLKSFYTREGQSCSSVLEVSGRPYCITVISEGKVAVSLPLSPRIITVAVTPDLELLSTIQTGKKYKGLSTLDQSTLVAGSSDPSSVDLIDIKGTILKTFTTLPAIGKSFISPHYIHVTRQGTILVSDCRLKSVICLTRSGDIVFTYTPTGDRALIYPWGITSTSTGDILVSDYTAHKVIHLSESGEFIRDILTSEDGLQYPTGLCVDGDKLYVTLFYKGLHKYRFG